MMYHCVRKNKYQFYLFEDCFAADVKILVMRATMGCKVQTHGEPVTGRLSTEIAMTCERAMLCHVRAAAP